jgi:hypothetical protein
VSLGAPSSACQHPHTCLAERHRAMRLTPPMGWNSKCLDCIEGAARQSDLFTPEPDGIAPKPLRDLGKPRTIRPPDRCATCGKVVTRGANQCKPCRGKARTALMPKKCASAGCRWKARRGGLCMTHYWRKRQAEKRALA